MRTTLRGSGPAPAGYVRCASPDCGSEGSHYHPQVAPELVPLEDADRQRPDPRPGFYYVSAIDGARKVFARGPFPTHREALDRVDATRTAVEKVDPRAPWYAWGTARSEVDQGPGVLDRWEAAKREPIDDRDVGREEGEDDAREFG
jgi:hypothetical protein